MATKRSREFYCQKSHHGVVLTTVLTDAEISDAGSDSFMIACCFRMRLNNNNNNNAIKIVIKTAYKK